MRADSGFYTHDVVAVCRKTKVRFSITVRLHQSLRNIIEAIPEEDWTPIPYWMEGAADVAETSYTPFDSEPDAAPVRLIVRRVKPTPGSQLGLQLSRFHHRSGWRDPGTGGRPLKECHPRPQVRRGAQPSPLLPRQRRRAGRPGHRPQLARWTARIGLGEQLVTTKTLRRRFFSLAGRLTRSARRLTLEGWPWENQFSRALARFRALPLPS